MKKLILTGLVASISSAGAVVVVGTDFKDGSNYDNVNLDNNFAGAGIIVSSWSHNGTGSLVQANQAAAIAGFSNPFVARLHAANGGTAPDYGNSSQFTVTIDAVTTLNLSDLTLVWRGATGNNEERSLGIQLQIGSGTPVEIYNELGQNRDDSGFTTAGLPLDLSAAQYQGLTDTTLTFVFDSYGNGSGAIEMTDLAINGAVIPEPSSFAIAGLGSLLLLRRRRTSK